MTKKRNFDFENELRYAMEDLSMEVFNFLQLNKLEC
jgi:hypothetical protein